MDAVRVITGRGVPLVRSDVDTDQIIPSDWLKRVERTGFGAGLFSEWRENSDFVLNQERYDGANDPRRRPELRHRLVTRARGVGADGLRLRGRAVAALRRHLPQQLREDGPRRGDGRPRPRSTGCGRRSRRTRTSRSSSTSSTSASPRRRSGSTCRSSSTTSRSTGCSTASTTSGSRCATPTPSTRYERSRPSLQAEHPVAATSSQ